MIMAQERTARQEIFQSIRSSIQELHADKVILDDVDGTPFLFKSKDAQIWARIFYRSMQDFSLKDLQQEIKKLWVLMPDNAVLYLFYPELDRGQILKMNGFSDRLSFFEYAGLLGAERESAGVRICKWVPVPAFAPKFLLEKGDPACSHNPQRSFLRHASLTPKEIAGLAELSLALHRA